MVAGGKEACGRVRSRELLTLPVATLLRPQPPCTGLLADPQYRPPFHADRYRLDFFKSAATAFRPASAKVTM